MTLINLVFSLFIIPVIRCVMFDSKGRKKAVFGVTLQFLPGLSVLVLPHEKLVWRAGCVLAAACLRT